MTLSILLAIAGYLVGAVSFARIVAAFVLPGQDLSRTKLVLPSRSTLPYTGVSATTLGARLGPRWGITVGVIDMLKGFLPVLACRALLPETTDYLVVATMIVIGHNWPIYYGFKGGRGQSPMLGGLLAIAPLAPLVCFPLGIALGLFIIRDMFAAYGLGHLLLVVWFMIFRSAPETVYSFTVNAAFLVASLPEIREYLRRRARGEIRQITSWRELLRAHPAMGSDRYQDKPK